MMHFSRYKRNSSREMEKCFGFRCEDQYHSHVGILKIMPRLAAGSFKYWKKGETSLENSPTRNPT